MPDGVAVRALTPGDAAAWWELRREALATAPLAFGRSVEEHDATTVAEVERRFADVASGNVTFGAFADGELVAIATFLRESRERERHKGGIYGVYVTSRRQGRGIGRQLMDEAIGHVRSDPSLEQILIYVTSTQVAARRLYERLGFVWFGCEPRSLKIGGRYVDMDGFVLDLRRP